MQKAGEESLTGAWSAVVTVGIIGSTAVQSSGLVLWRREIMVSDSTATTMCGFSGFYLSFIVTAVSSSVEPLLA